MNKKTDSNITDDEIHCAECGMRLKRGGEYHPYAACLMFKACFSTETVRRNLQAVVEHGKDLQRREGEL